MFNKYMFKNIPTKYAFAGYCVRKGLSQMTTPDQQGNIVYDVFTETYVDNFLSFFILMDDGTYKHVDGKESVVSIDMNEFMSKHIYRGAYYDVSQLPMYDKEEVIGVFGLRDIITLEKQIDEMEKEFESRDMSIQAILGEKPQYTGLEITGAINRFNKDLKREKKRILIPPIKYGPEDTYVSLIGDELDFNDFLTNKSSDQIINDIITLDNKVDGVGNLK